MFDLLGVSVVNKLYYGDCLTIMQTMEPESVDLIYLDPPFNSNRAYNAIYTDETGNPLPDQIEAFNDKWTLNRDRERAIRNMPIIMREADVDSAVIEFWRIWMKALRNTQPDLLAYLSYMVERLIWMRGILKRSGSIYLHCDPTASHYLKVMMDGIFGHSNFLNEVVWHYGKWTNAARHFQKNHDVLLVYVKNKGHHNFNKLYKDKPSYHYEKGWHTNTVKGGVSQLIVYDKEKAKMKIASGKYDKVIYREGKTKAALPDVWDIPIINPSAKERMGYKTQKPLALLERIIEASSNPDALVFDPFCGCATTLEAAHKLRRKWIGIDIAIHAIKRVARVRLEERLQLVEDRDFVVKGVPRNLEGAKDLWRRDKYQFQKWCVEQVDGFVTTKQTADGGIDGRIYFRLWGEQDLQSMILEVKGGKNVSIVDVRNLKNVLDDSDAQMAGLIIMEPLGSRKLKNFQAKMAMAGDLKIEGKLYPRMQMLTVKSVLQGGRFNVPNIRGRDETLGQKQLL